MARPAIPFLLLIALVALPVVPLISAEPAVAQNNGQAKGNPGGGNNGKGPNPSRGNAGKNSGNNTSSGGVRFAPPFAGN
ncbi:hypothetical protein [Cyanobium sp. ATX 6F1]|uniref:hypothetical protein n=1 Tax=Cyanobium sp. ATX 6F1 TaxID=2823702 RepID=UPI0020CECC4A|nr:hypothetical protein [Cyanobium sp. ATX 6F1]MCP9917505.1 hypothetical protein [Cyanobium sp. ATX 6F1]